uniref:Tyrosinase copper-binding domain-containing protein n=1 Tax=Portulaca oleracea TaxID=46147 RepID=I4DD58_POROL|nr:hypothetical protein [Portulaca oleracea]
MESFTLTTTTIPTISNTFFPKTSQLSLSRCQTRHASPKISCKATKNDDENPRKIHEDKTIANKKLDRRNMLIGLGGLYGAATALGSDPTTLAAPITAPNIAQCGPADLPQDAQGDHNCCPPVAQNIIDFTLPPTPATLKVRPAAHSVDNEYLQKFNRAISLMKALPDTDPRSFSQQAKVHCAYCDGGYNQVGFPNLDLQVHGSWLFLPFHRCYLYFFERILGNLINDPTFAMPFWNWDNPAGMQMPAIYADRNSPLYDSERDGPHQPPTLVDLNFDGEDTDMSTDDLTTANLTVMYRQMVSNAKTARLFLGQPYKAGGSPRGGGSLENVPHGPVHIWTGDRNQPNTEDMGNFYSAARDPIFYAHHSNIDRMWSIWKTLGANRVEFTDSDWLDASFVFYDENAQAVKIRVRDCLDTKKLGYTYQDVDLPWLNSQPTPKRSRIATLFSKLKPAKATTHPPSTSTSPVKFPKPLDSTLKIDIQRPKKSRSKKEKKLQEEVLVVEVELQSDVFVKFDVYVNDEDDVPLKKTIVKTEYAGSFANVPHKHKHKKEHRKMKTTLRLGLTDLIEDLGADDDDGVMVTLVPRSGKEVTIIKDVKIEFAS